MEDTQEGTPYYKLKVCASACASLAIALSSLYIFIVHLHSFLSELYYLENIVTMHKSMYAFFGAFLTFFTLFIAALCFKIFKIAKESDYEKVFLTLFVSGLPLMFLIPNIIHLSTSGFLERNGYTFCSEMSHIMRKSSERVYVKDPKFCVKKEIFKPRKKYLNDTLV